MASACRALTLVIALSAMPSSPHCAQYAPRAFISQQQASAVPVGLTAQDAKA